MDFTLSKEHQMLKRSLREFVESELAPVARDTDLHERQTEANLGKMARAGMFGLPFPQKYGGAGMGELGYCLMMEETARVDSSTTTILGAHIGIGAMTIYLDGTEEQKQKYLVPAARGELLAAFALTEPGAGSDAAGIRTNAVRKGDEYILNGSKIWITNGPTAGVITVFAVTDRTLGARGGVTAFLVEPSFEGFSVGKLYDKMGIRGSGTAEIVMQDCRVPKANVLGKVGLGFITAMKTLDGGRLGLGAGSLGGAEAALEACVAYAKRKFVCDRGQLTPLAYQQYVQWVVADIAADVYALRQMVYHCAHMADSGQKFSQESAIVKMFGSEVGARAIERVQQVMGQDGVMVGGNIERGMRDERISRIFEGTNEIQRTVIAGEIFKKVGLKV